MQFLNYVKKAKKLEVKVKLLQRYMIVNKSLKKPLISQAFNFFILESHT